MAVFCDSIETRLNLATAVMGAVRVGLIALDVEERIVLWNDWMAQTSSMAKEDALGRHFCRLFPELKGSRVYVAIKSALENGYPSLLSQSLNKAPFPLYARDGNSGAEQRIQQAIQVMPIAVPGMQRHCVIQITDVTAAVSRERLLREQALELRVHSHVDGLTGIANRRRFDEYLESEFRRTRRSHSPLSLIMIDIDFFKAYNDAYGHQAGDLCMVRVAKAFSGALRRPGDMVARYGGEEFAVVLPDTDAQGARTIADNLRQAIEGLKIEHVQSKASNRVTISLGVATTTAGRETHPSALISAADGALYQAKHEGRNRVNIYDPTQACGLKG